MVFSHIHSSNDKEQINKLNRHITKGKPTFVLIFMEGCGPCNATRPEWGKLENVLSKYKNDENMLIVDVDQNVLEELHSIKEKPVGYPTILYIQGNNVENYEGGRTITDFVKWIQGKNKMKSGTSNVSASASLLQKGGKSRKKSKKMNGTRKIKKNKKMNRTKKSRKQKVGGLVVSSNQEMDNKLNQFNVSNTEIIFFLINFLEKSELKTILLSHHKFIDTIETQKLVFGENAELRSFINDIIQWFLLDYNKDFLNSVLEIVKNTLENPLFLNKDITWNERYNILLENVYYMIEKYNNNKNIDIFVLLEIILKLLRMPNVKEKIIENINKQENTIISFKHTMICLLDVLIKENLIHNPEVRGLLKKMIEELSYNNISSLWITFKKLSGLIQKCSVSIGSDLSSIAAKKVYNTTSNAAKNIYGNTIGKLF